MHDISLHTAQQGVLFDSGEGICLDCGDIGSTIIEPDAEGYACEACGERTVCGISYAVERGLVTIDGVEVS